MDGLRKPDPGEGIYHYICRYILTNFPLIYSRCNIFYIQYSMKLLLTLVKAVIRNESKLYKSMLFVGL